MSHIIFKQNLPAKYPSLNIYAHDYLEYNLEIPTK